MNNKNWSLADDSSFIPYYNQNSVHFAFLLI